MRYAKLFSLLIISVIGLYGAVGLYFLPLAGFEGDLTRVGMLPEKMFGWTKPQPTIDPKLLRSASWQEADVLVVGDSFSEQRVWQSILVKHGLRVRTEHWTSMRGGVCQDIYPWLKTKGFKGKIIIFEMIERNLEVAEQAWLNCQKIDFHPSVNSDKPVQQRLTARPEKDWGGRLSVGIETKLNSLRYIALSAKTNFSEWDTLKGTTVKRVPRGCDLFSHQKCQDALFRSTDRLIDFPDASLENIQTLNSRVGDITPFWVFMPDKSTIYLHPDKQFWNKAEQRFNAPNVLRTMREALNRGVVDLYPANNSHLSTTGYLLLGEAVYQTLASTLPRR